MSNNEQDPDGARHDQTPDHRRHADHQVREFPILFMQFGGQLLQLLGCLWLCCRRCGVGRYGQPLDLEAQPRLRPPDAAICTGQPVAEVEQLPRGRQRVGRRHLLRAVHCKVAQVLDDSGLGDQRRADQSAKRRLVDHGVEPVVVGCAQRGVVEHHIGRDALRFGDRGALVVRSAINEY